MEFFLSPFFFSFFFATFSSNLVSYTFNRFYISIRQSSSLVFFFFFHFYSTISLSVRSARLFHIIIHARRMSFSRVLLKTILYCSLSLSLSLLLIAGSKETYRYIILHCFYNYYNNRFINCSHIPSPIHTDFPSRSFHATSSREKKIKHSRTC